MVARPQGGRPGPGVGMLGPLRPHETSNPRISIVEEAAKLNLPPRPGAAPTAFERVRLAQLSRNAIRMAQVRTAAMAAYAAGIALIGFVVQPGKTGVLHTLPWALSYLCASA